MKLGNCQKDGLPKKNAVQTFRENLAAALDDNQKPSITQLQARQAINSKNESIPLPQLPEGDEIYGLEKWFFIMQDAFDEFYYFYEAGQDIKKYLEMIDNHISGLKKIQKSIKKEAKKETKKGKQDQKNKSHVNSNISQESIASTSVEISKIEENKLITNEQIEANKEHNKQLNQKKSEELLKIKEQREIKRALKQEKIKLRSHILTNLVELDESAQIEEAEKENHSLTNLAYLWEKNPEQMQTIYNWLADNNEAIEKKDLENIAKALASNLIETAKFQSFKIFDESSASSHFAVHIPQIYKKWPKNSKGEFALTPKFMGTINTWAHSKETHNKLKLSDFAIARCLKGFIKIGFTKERLDKTFPSTSRPQLG